MPRTPDLPVELPSHYTSFQETATRADLSYSGLNDSIFVAVQLALAFVILYTIYTIIRDVRDDMRVSRRSEPPRVAIFGRTFRRK